MAIEIRAAIGSIPNREGWFRIWKIAAVLWVVIVGAIRLWPEPTPTPADPVPSYMYPPLIMTTPLTRAQEADRKVIMLLTEAGIIIGVPAAVPALVVLSAVLIGWVREGFRGA